MNRWCHPYALGDTTRFFGPCFPFPCFVPYKIDPRRRITLNFHADEHAVLTADAARAGHASAYAYTMALVQARGAALGPVVDAHGAQRVARLKTMLAAARRELADCQTARAADATRCWALERELATRPTGAWYQQQLAAAVAQAMAGFSLQRREKLR